MRRTCRSAIQFPLIPLSCHSLPRLAGACPHLLQVVPEPLLPSGARLPAAAPFTPSSLKSITTPAVRLFPTPLRFPAAPRIRILETIRPQQSPRCLLCLLTTYPLRKAIADSQVQSSQSHSRPRARRSSPSISSPLTARQQSRVTTPPSMGRSLSCPDN